MGGGDGWDSESRLGRKRQLWAGCKESEEDAWDGTIASFLEANFPSMGSRAEKGNGWMRYGNRNGPAGGLY